MSKVRQREIQEVVDRLARFRPTHVVVEWPISGQGKLDQRYADYRAGRYLLGPNEIDQLGLRLAAKLGLPRVDAGDWNELPPGPEESYNFPAYAVRAGQQPLLDSIRASNNVAALNSRLRSEDVRHWFLRVNSDEFQSKAARHYFDYPLLGDDENNPGANWVANWQGRNLKIFAHLVRLAKRSDDRILVIFGSGHVAPLTYDLKTSGAFNVLSPIPLLRNR